MAENGGQEKIDIVLVTFQRLHLLKITVKAINVRTKHPYRLIVVDNSSSDGTHDWLVEAKERGLVDMIILMPENVGLGKGFQKGLEYVESEYFVTCADDLIPPKTDPCWLTQELETMKKHPNHAGIAMRGCRISKIKDLDDDLK